MIKVIWQLRRNPERTIQEFRDYWWNVHVPLLKSLMPELVHYVGCFPIDSQEATLTGGDAIVELGFPSAEIMESTFSTVWMVPDRIASSEHLLSLPPEWEAKVRVIGGTGESPVRIPQVAATSVPGVPSQPLPKPGQVRAISRVRRNPQLTMEDFENYLVNVHMPLVGERLPSLRKHVACFPLENSSVDAVLEVTFDDVDTLTREMNAPSFLDAVYDHSVAHAFEKSTIDSFVVGVVDAL